MHPQAQLPQSAAQRQQAVQQKKDQPEEFSQYQKYQQVSYASFIDISRTSNKPSSNSRDSKNKKRRKKPRRSTRRQILCNLKHRRCQHWLQHSNTIASWMITSRTVYLTTIDIARSREPVNTALTAATGIPITGRQINNVAKDIATRNTRILTSTSRANSMSREGRPMTTCGDMNWGLILVYNVL